MTASLTSPLTRLPLVTCIDASHQPLLERGARYEIVADVHSAKTARHETASGYVVRGELQTKALPCVFQRARFSPTLSGVGTGEE